MGLNIGVGILADAAEDDDAIDHLTEEFISVREALRATGLPDWHEPHVEDVVDYDMYGYSGLHYVRRLAVHVMASGQLPEPAEKDADDPLLDEIYTRSPRYAYAVETGETFGSADDAAGGFDHLIYHSDAEGYYVPVDFAQVLVDERVTGGYIGSSYRLLDECLRLAALLGLPDDLDPESDVVWNAADGDISDPDVMWQRYGVESYCCIRLIACARASIKTGAAIAFC